MSKRTIRGRSLVPGFAITNVGTRRRMLERLRPEGGFIPLNLDFLDVVAELDPGLIAWRDRVTPAPGHTRLTLS